MNDFSASGMVRAGWDVFKKRPWFLIGSYVLAFVVFGIVSGAVTQIQNGQGGPLALVAFLVNLAVQTLFGLGITAFLLKAHDNVEGVRLADLWHPHSFWNFLAVSLIYGILSLAGFILLIIPGLIVTIVYGFSSYIVIARGKGPIEAMKESARITRGYRWELLVLLLLVIVLNVLGAICFLVGLLVSIPVTSLAMVHAYRTLEQKASEPVLAM